MTKEGEGNLATDNKSIRVGDDWWVLFPMKGVSITDANAELETPAWGDATLVSVAHLPSLVKRLVQNDRIDPSHDHERDMLFILGGMTEAGGIRFRQPEESPDSFLVVRRRLDRSADGHPRIPKGAINRAACLEAALAVGLLRDKRFGSETCSLIRHGKPPLSPTAALDFGNGGFLAQFGGPRALFVSADPPIKHSLTELCSMLSSSKWTATVNALLSQPLRTDSKLLGNLRRATCRLAAACFALSAESQVTGMVTALEMLLSVDGDFGALERRTLLVLADIPDAPSTIHCLLKARHEYVHQGKDVDLQVPPCALIAVLNIIERIGKCQSAFATQEQLCAYIDAMLAVAHLRDRLPSLTVEDVLGNKPPWMNVTS